MARFRTLPDLFCFFQSMSKPSVFSNLQESAEETMKELGRFHNNEKVIAFKIVLKTKGGATEKGEFIKYC